MTEAISNAASASKTSTPQQLRRVSQDFESLFIHQMLQAMRKTVPNQQSLLGDSQASQIYRELFDEEVSKQAAYGKGMGLAPIVLREISPKEKGTSADKTKGRTLP